MQGSSWISNKLRIERWGIAIFAFLLLFVDQFTIRLATFRAEDLVTWRYWANQILSLLFIYGFLILVSRSFHAPPFQKNVFFRRWLFAANVFEILIFLAIQTNHFLVYQKPVSSFSVRFLFENPAMSAQLSVENIQVLQTILRVAPGIALIWMFLARVQSQPPPSRIQSWAGGLLFLVSVGVSTFAWFSVPVVQHSLLSATSAFADLVRVPASGLAAGAGIESRARIPLGRLNCGWEIGPRQQPPSVIWVIGESVVASRLGIYGHSRPTTDFLSEELQSGRLVRFNNVVSIGTVTRISLPYLFFGMQGPDSSDRIFSRPSVFDFAKAAGLKTAFIGAQELRWGNQDKIIINENVDVYKSGTDFDRKAGVSMGADDLEVFDRGVIPFLQSVEEPFFATLHMDGSHYPYSKHSHPQFKKFLPELSANDVNAYDNTLVQLDAYFRQLMQLVRSKHPNAWVFYTSDHGQNVSGQAKFNNGFAQDVIRVPLFVFPPLGELGKVSKVQKLRRQVHSPTSHADMFATTLDILGCNSDSSEPIESQSLFKSISPSRLRTVSELMSSHFVDDKFAVVTPSGQLYEVDTAKRTVLLPQGDLLRLSDWHEDSAQHRRLKAEIERLMSR